MAPQALDTQRLTTQQSHFVSAGFVLHHGLGLVSCALGLYGNRMALFGAAIQVFFEGTTPLLHVLGCLRAMRLAHTRLFLAAGALPLE